MVPAFGRALAGSIEHASVDEKEAKLAHQAFLQSLFPA